MPRLLLATSVILTILGIGLSIYGITAEEFKPGAVGLVLILGAGVFAKLYRGTRRLHDTTVLHNRQI